MFLWKGSNYREKLLRMFCCGNLSLYYFLYLSVHLIGNMTEKERGVRERQAGWRFIHGSLFKYLQQLRMSKNESRTWKPNTNLPQGWNGPSYLSHVPLSPEMHMNRKLELWTEPGLQVDTESGSGWPTGAFTVRQRPPYLVLFYTHKTSLQSCMCSSFCTLQYSHTQNR